MMLPETDTQPPPPILLLPTPRQLQVLRLVANSHTQKQIAALLGISVSGVRRRLQHARARMGMSTIEIIMYLVEVGEIRRPNA